MKTLILTEAGEGVGFGHLSRALAIKEELEEGSKIVCAGFGDFTFPDGVEEFDWLKNPLELNEFTKVIVDSYLMDEDKESEIREKFSRFVVIDDYNRKTYKCDLLINPNGYGDTIDYSNQNCRLVGGKQYVPIREELIKNKKPKPITFIKNLLITVGGNDGNNILPKLIQAFKDDFVKTTVLVGNKKQKEALESSFTDIKVLTNQSPKDLAELFSFTDIAITAGGVTMNELAFCGTPLIAIKTSEDQKHNLEFFQKEQIVDSFFDAQDEKLIEGVKKELGTLQDEEIRKQISFRSQVLINGKGARNIAKEIENI